MEIWPEFVTEEQEDKSTARGRCGVLTGWETVIFELGDDCDYEPGSVFETASLAP